jgi:predicted unusual protein kinase regulating ubiquinone biosynthesis (AarF/ABC1/UbiB family)
MVNGIRGVGVLLPSADTAELERAMTKLFARFGGMGFAELQDVDPREFRAFADEFGDVVRSLPFQFPENFLLIIRAMSLTSGMCSSLNPAFNIWDAVEPYSEQLIRAEGGNLLKDAAAQAMTFARTVIGLPQRLDDLATRAEDGTLAVQSPRLERRIAALDRTTRRLVSAVLFGVLLIAGVLLRSSDEVFGTVLMWLSVLPLLHAVFAGLVGRRGPLP